MRLMRYMGDGVRSCSCQPCGVKPFSEIVPRMRLMRYQGDEAARLLMPAPPCEIILGDIRRQNDAGSLWSQQVNDFVAVLASLHHAGSEWTARRRAILYRRGLRRGLSKGISVRILCMMINGKRGHAGDAPDFFPRYRSHISRENCCVPDD